nr:SRPBCC family protein [uncultured Sphingomonas sp.]
MTNALTIQSYSTLIEPDTLRIQRLLPGPIARVFAYLTDSDLRRKWLAAGEMTQQVGAPFTLTWRNDELSGGADGRPEGFPEEHSMDSKILEIDAPRRLAFAWGENGKVTMALEEQGSDVLLTLTHERLPADRGTRLNISAGWHAHLDVLAAAATGTEPAPFWSHWASLKQEYGARLPA